MRTSTKTTQAAQRQEQNVSFFAPHIKQGADTQRIMNDTFFKNAIDLGGIKVGYLPLSEMIIDMNYQRKPQSKINKMSREWDIQKCGLITVAYRDGKFAIVNGQNRYLAALQVGETCLPCQILKTKEPREEAKVYFEQDDNVTKLNTFDKFKAEIYYGEPTALIIKELCDKYSISTKKTAGTTTGALKGLSATKRIYNTYGAEALTWIFDTIQDCGWHSVKGGYGDIIISVLCNMYLYHKDELDIVTPKIVKILDETTPDIICNRACGTYVSRGKNSALTAYLEKCLKVLDEKTIFIS